MFQQKAVGDKLTKALQVAVVGEALETEFLKEDCCSSETCNGDEREAELFRYNQANQEKSLRRAMGRRRGY